MPGAAANPAGRAVLVPAQPGADSQGSAFTLTPEHIRPPRVPPGLYQRGASCAQLSPPPRLPCPRPARLAALRALPSFRVPVGLQQRRAGGERGRACASLPRVLSPPFQAAALKEREGFSGSRHHILRPAGGSSPRHPSALDGLAPLRSPAAKAPREGRTGGGRLLRQRDQRSGASFIPESPQKRGVLCKAPAGPGPIPPPSPPIPFGSPGPARCSLPPGKGYLRLRDSAPPAAGTNPPAPRAAALLRPQPPGRSPSRERSPRSAAPLRRRAGTAAAPPGRRDGASRPGLPPAGRGGRSSGRGGCRSPGGDSLGPPTLPKVGLEAGSRRRRRQQPSAGMLCVPTSPPACRCSPPPARGRPYLALCPRRCRSRPPSTEAAAPCRGCGVCALREERRLLGGAGSTRSVPTGERKGFHGSPAFPPLIELPSSPENSF